MVRSMLFTVLVVLMMSVVVFAQPADEKEPDVKGEIVAEKVVKVEEEVNGETVIKETFVSADEASPGDTLRYTVRYWNEGDKPAKGLVLVGPIPENTKYLDGTATQPKATDVKYSIDNGQTYHTPPIKYTVIEKDENGNDVEVEKIATPDMYTQIQWTFKPVLKPDEQFEVFYRVEVE